MVKKTWCICLALCVALLCCGCRKNGQDEVVLYEDGATVVGSAEEPSAQEDAEDSGETDPAETGGMPLVKTEDVALPNVRQLFGTALAVYEDLSKGTVPVDVELGRFELKNGDSHGNYYRTNDSRFDSVAELEAYLHRYFTDACIQTFYDESRFLDYEGHLYMMPGAAESDPLYAGYAFSLVRQTTKRIQFDVIVYRYASGEDMPVDAEPFVGTPDETSLFQTKSHRYTVEVDDDRATWRFSEFESID